MQALGSSDTLFYGSNDSTEVLEHTYSGPDLGLPKDFARSIVESPLSKLHEIALFQDDVSQARKDLLVERSKTKSAGDAVRSQRIVTGNIEGQLFNALRDFYNTNIGTLPPAIAQVYERVIQERDRLGSIEDSYIEAERALGGSEWRFMQKEAMLYQYHFPDLRALMDSIIPQAYPRTEMRPPPPPPPDPVLLGPQTVLVYDAPPPPPPHPPEIQSLNSGEPSIMTGLRPTTQVEPTLEASLNTQYRTAVDELETLRKDFDSLRPKQSELLETELEERITHAEAPEHRVRSQELFEQYSTLLDKLVKKEVQVQRLRHKIWEYSSSKNDLGRRMPDEWMLNNFKTNFMDRKIYMNVLEDTGIPIPLAWEEMSERYWWPNTTDSSSGDGHNQAVEHRSISTSSISSDDDRSVQTSATFQGQPPIQGSRRSVVSWASEEIFPCVGSHGVATESSAHRTKESVPDGQRPFLVKRNAHSIDLQRPGRPLESPNHHRRKSTSAKLEQQTDTETHENVVATPFFLHRRLCVS